MKPAALLRWVPAFALMGAIAWSSQQSTWPEAAEGLPDWLLHGCAFGALALTYLFALQGLRRRQPWRAAALAVALASLYGVSDELHQSFIAGRDASVVDWLADTAGATLASLAATLRRQR